MIETTAQPRLKKDGTPKKSGGKRVGAGAKSGSGSGGMRSGAGRKSKMENENLLLEWRRQIHRALKLATSNHGCLPKESFFTKREIRAIYGQEAHDEFSTWFKSLRRFDQSKADQIRHKQEKGLYKGRPAKWDIEKQGPYSPEKYANWLIRNKCFSWVTFLDWSREQEAWEKYGDSTSPWDT